jgi:hypothetical protein
MEERKEKIAPQQRIIANTFKKFKNKFETFEQMRDECVAFYKYMKKNGFKTESGQNINSLESFTQHNIKRILEEGYSFINDGSFPFEEDLEEKRNFELIIQFVKTRFVYSYQLEWWEYDEKINRNMLFDLYSKIGESNLREWINNYPSKQLETYTNPDGIKFLDKSQLVNKCRESGVDVKKHLPSSNL